MAQDSSSQAVSKAIVIWSGWGETAYPARDEGRLRRAVGEAEAQHLIPRIREIESEFYATNARFVAADLTEMGNLATSDFRRKRTDLSAEAVEALAWCYTYDYK